MASELVNGFCSCLACVGNGPRAILQDGPANGRDDDDEEKREQKFAYSEILRRAGCHGTRRNLRISAIVVKVEREREAIS